MGEAKSRQEILLESGTNELEVLVFSLGPTRYGVNVAKVREIIGQVKVVNVPMMHPAVVGVFKLRESVIPLVDLQLYFEPGVPSQTEQRTVILMEFNELQIGFVVDGVDRIFRLSWSEVRPMPTVQKNIRSVITSVCEVDGHLALMVDFEKIAFDISGDKDIFRIAADANRMSPTERGAQHVLLAEDSSTIRDAIHSKLVQAGYTSVTPTSDGSEAWSLLEGSLANEDAAPFTLVITDIETPRMDGLHLCKRIREHPQLRHLPVVVFSSLVSDTNIKKCKAVGANAAISKPQMARVVELLDQLLGSLDSEDSRVKEDLLLAVD